MTESKEEWCERTYRHVDEDHGPVQRWALSGRASSLGRFANFATVDRATVGEADALYDAIEREVGNSGMQEVRVRAHQRGAKDQLSQRRWEVLYSEEDEPEAGPSSDIATQLVTQAIRHTEHYHSTSQAGLRDTIRYLSAELAASREESAGLRGAWKDQYRLVQELEDRKLERDQAAERSLTVNQGLRAVAGAVQFKMLGATPTAEEHKGALAQALSLFAESLSEDQVESVRSALRPEQQIALGALLAKSEAVTTGQDDGEEEDEEEEEDDTEDNTVPMVAPDMLKMLKEALTTEEYAQVLLLLRLDRSLIKEPDRLVRSAKETVAKQSKASTEDDEDKSTEVSDDTGGIDDA